MSAWTSCLSAIAVIPMTVGPAPAPPPEWLMEEMRRLVTDGQAWITDNAANKSAEEPWEQYGLQWRWEADSTAITGRLFGLIGGEDRATFWEMRLSWDEEQKVARVR